MVRSVSAFATKWKWVGGGVAAIVLLLPVQVGPVRVFNEAALSLSLLLVALAFLLGPSTFEPVDGAVALLALAFSSCFLLVAMTHPGQPSVAKDLLEACKPILYGALVVLGTQCQRALSSHVIRRAVVALAVVSVVHSAMVFVPPLHPLVDLWKGRPSTSAWNFHFERFSGTLAYPDILGMWLVLALLVVVDEWMFQPSTRPRSVFEAAAIAVGLLLTGSRGAVVVGLFGGAAYLIVHARALGPRRMAGAVAAAVLVGGALGAAVVSSQVAAASYFRQTITEGVADGSLLHRVREFGLLMDSWQSGSFFGNGPQNAYLFGSYGPVESGIFYYGYKFGVLGFGFLSVVVLALTVCLGASGERRGIAKVYGIWGIVAVTVGGVSMSITEEYKSFLMFFFLLGVSIQEILSVKKPLRRANRMHTAPSTQLL